MLIFIPSLLIYLGKCRGMEILKTCAPDYVLVTSSVNIHQATDTIGDSIRKQVSRIESIKAAGSQRGFPFREQFVSLLN